MIDEDGAAVGGQRTGKQLPRSGFVQLRWRESGIWLTGSAPSGIELCAAGGWTSEALSVLSGLALSSERQARRQPFLLLDAVILGVRLGGLGSVVLGVQLVTVRRVGVVGGLLVLASSVMLRGFAVVVRGLLVVLGGLLVMFVFEHLALLPA
jgi:hypothetical protein